MKTTTTILALSILLIQDLYAQIDTINLKNKFIFTVNSGISGIIRTDAEYFDYTIDLGVKGGYFFTPRLLTMVGIEGRFSESNLTDKLEQWRILSISPGFRYYFTPRNRLFIESGMQYGQFTYRSEASDSFSFLQAGIGGGVNFLFYHGFAGGRLMFECVFRYNFNLAEKPVNVNRAHLLNFLGSGFGITYIFPALPAAAPIQKIPVEPIKGLHSFQFDPNARRISYKYEMPMRNLNTLGIELTVDEFMGVFDTDMLFVPGIRLDLRNYYGYFKRQERGQITTNRSSDFVSFVIVCRLLYEENAEEPIFQFGFIPRWGVRRTITGSLFFEMAIGFSVSKVPNYKWQINPHLSPVIGFGF